VNDSFIASKSPVNGALKLEAGETLIPVGLKSQWLRTQPNAKKMRLFTIETSRPASGTATLFFDRADK